MLPADARSGTTVGKYRLHEIVGRGGMGVVYRGEHVYIGKEVAVKILHDGYGGREESIKRFLREARAASLINHPNIVTVTDFGKGHDGTVFFVMELLRGQALDALMQREGQLTLMRTITILNQVAAALAAAHSKGIIHRDLKPENVMLIAREGRRELLRSVDDESGAHTITEREKTFDFVKILDFGVAKVRDGETSKTRTTTQAGVVFGTPEYMAPETARVGFSDVRSDIYALGAMFYEMLTGSVPFSGETPMDVMLKQVNAVLQAPRDRAPGAEITEEAERLIVKALSKNPDERHQTMEEFHRDLQKCYGEVRYRRVIRTPAGLPTHRTPAPEAQVEWSEITPPTVSAVSMTDNGSPIPLLRRKPSPASPPLAASAVGKGVVKGELLAGAVRQPPQAAPVLLTKKKERPGGASTPGPSPHAAAPTHAAPTPVAPHRMPHAAHATTPEPSTQRRKTLPMGSEVLRHGRPATQPQAQPTFPAAPLSAPQPGSPSSPQAGSPTNPYASPNATPHPLLPQRQATRRPLHEGDPNGDVVTPPPSAQRRR